LPVTREGIYKGILEGVKEKIATLRRSEIVIGIPFIGTPEQMVPLQKIIEIAHQGMREFYPGRRVAVVVAGAHEGRRMLTRIGRILSEQKIKGYCFALEEEVDGKGWTLRALMEASECLGADLILVEPDFLKKGKQGIQPRWIFSIYRPIELGNDFVLPVFNRPPEGKRVTDHLVTP